MTMKPLRLFDGQGSPFAQKLLSAVRKAAEAHFTKNVTQKTNDLFWSTIVQRNRTAELGTIRAMAIMSLDAMEERLESLKEDQQRTARMDARFRRLTGQLYDDEIRLLEEKLKTCPPR